MYLCGGPGRFIPGPRAGLPSALPCALHGRSSDEAAAEAAAGLIGRGLAIEIAWRVAAARGMLEWVTDPEAAVTLLGASEVLARAVILFGSWTALSVMC